VLNGDPTASTREIAQEAKLSTSTVFCVLPTRMGDSYRRYRLAPQNLSEPQKTDHLRQSQKLVEILQNAKRLRWRFILMGHESWFSYLNEDRKCGFILIQTSRKWRGD
jgi:hypothetical protein